MNDQTAPVQGSEQASASAADAAPLVDAPKAKKPKPAKSSAPEGKVYMLHCHPGHPTYAVGHVYLVEADEARGQINLGRAREVTPEEIANYETQYGKIG